MRAPTVDEQGEADAFETVVVLTPDRPSDVGLGGKGRSLAALVTAGFPVPATGVVTTAAYRQVAADPTLQVRIRSIINGEPADAAIVDRWFAEVHVPPELSAAITEVARRVGAGGRVAVRSSATVEDLHGSSFAGQYRSFLNVDSTDPDAVLAAVRRVWASLWHPAPTAYRRAFGIDEDAASMAVVVMQMVDATTAGVVFTVDPGGERGAARIEQVDGLGEALVSGQTTPSAWVVARDAPGSLPATPRSALEWALAAEDLTGIPQDVEWAATDDAVFVVQARPITVLDTDDGFDSTLDEHELTTAGIVEMVPGVLPALRWEVNSFLLEEAFRSVLDSLGIIRGSDVEDRPFVRRVRGRAAVDFDQLRDAASSVPGAVQELEQQYFGSPDSAPLQFPAPARRIAALRRDLRTLRTRRNVIAQAEVLIRTVAALRHRRPDLVAMTDEQVLAYLRRITDLAARGLAAELGVAASGAAAYSRLEAILAGHLGVDVAGPAVRRLAVGTGPVAERQVHSSAAVFAGPTWEETGRQPVRLPPRQPDEHSAALAEVEARLKALPGWRRKRLLTGQFVDIRVHLVRRTVTEVVEQLHRREAAKGAFLELGGEARRGHLELGTRLVVRGVLEDPVDIELLSTAEITDALVGRRTVVGDQVGRRRNWLSLFEAEGQLPVRFTGVPSREPVALPAGDVLHGWAASPGRRRGVARVIAGPTEQLRRGDVLVAEATDASWSPLFIRAGAVIVERGGPLSHAAILARELGLPAVLNLPGATRVLDGRMVSIDGDQGIVVIEDVEATE